MNLYIFIENYSRPGEHNLHDIFISIWQMAEELINCSENARDLIRLRSRLCFEFQMVLSNAVYV